MYRILFITNVPSPYRVDFFNELGKTCDLTVLFEALHASDRDSKWESSNFKSFRAIVLKGIRIRSDQSLCLGILKVIRKKWNCIIFGGYSSPTSMLAITYLKSHRIPFVLEADGGLINSGESKISYLIKRHFISSASWWFTSGKKTTEYLAYYGAKSEQCIFYPFTSLTQEDMLQATQRLQNEDKKQLRRRLGMKETYIILSVGRFSYRNGYGKGFDIVMKAAEQLSPEIGVYIVGEKPTEEFVAWKETKKLEHVHFVDFKSKKELSDYYLASDIFVLMTRCDIWGLVINEAMMFGLPVISTETCVAATELVKEDENGFILCAEDVSGLVERIHILISDEKKRLQFGKESWKRIQAYTIEKMVEAHNEFIEKQTN